MSLARTSKGVTSKVPQIMKLWTHPLKKRQCKAGMVWKQRFSYMTLRWTTLLTSIGDKILSSLLLPLCACVCVNLCVLSCFVKTGESFGWRYAHKFANSLPFVPEGEWCDPFSFSCSKSDCSYAPCSGKEGDLLTAWKFSPSHWQLRNIVGNPFPCEIMSLGSLVGLNFHKLLACS